MLNLPEIILIIVIIVIVFGVGKLSNVGTSLGKVGRSFKKGLGNEEREEPESDSDLIDITPDQDEDRRSKPYGRKPGRGDDEIEDAEVQAGDSGEDESE